MVYYLNFSDEADYLFNLIHHNIVHIRHR